MKEKHPEPHTYLLRIWPVQIHGRTAWRAALQTIPNGERRGFASLEQFFAYLQEQAAQESATSESPPNENKPIPE